MNLNLSFSYLFFALGGKPGFVQVSFITSSLQKTLDPPGNYKICMLDIKCHRYASLSYVLTWHIVNQFIYDSCKSNLFFVFACNPYSIIFTFCSIHKQPLFACLVSYSSSTLTIDLKPRVHWYHIRVNFLLRFYSNFYF